MSGGQSVGSDADRIGELADRARCHAESVCAKIDASELDPAAKAHRKRAVWRQAEDFIDDLIS